jgi:metal-responsive CopG/Arc/MetJ family transcriptional regulator
VGEIGMTMRCSFTLDDELMDLIDQYAKEHLIDRNKAILDLIEIGLANQDGGEGSIKKTHNFEEIRAIRHEIESLKKIMEDLKSEIRLMSHMMDSDWRKEARGVPFQSKRWWKFWK